MKRLLPIVLLAACAAPEPAPTGTLAEVLAPAAPPAGEPPPKPKLPPAEETYALALAAAHRASLVEPSSGTSAEEIQALLDRRARLVSEALSVATQIQVNQPYGARAFGHRLIARTLLDMARALDRLGPVPGLEARTSKLREEARTALRLCLSFDEPGDVVGSCRDELAASPGEEVAAALRHRADELSACAGEAPPPSLLVRLKVTEEGAVRDVVLEPDPGPAIAACVAEKAKALSLPRRPGGGELELELPLLSAPAAPR